MATLAHGSGFLAVFVAGILIGDARAPYKREVEHFHSGSASLVGDRGLRRARAHRRPERARAPGGLVAGLVLAAVLTVVIRPAVVGPLLAGPD